jgi:ParB-like chromosome segregation protein Spo0J
MKIEMVDIETLIPYARNARTHSEQQVTQIAASIREFGFNNPVLIDGQTTIIAGHGRVLGAKKLGLDRVPCIRLTHMTDAQRRAYILADNRIALNSGWDDAMLALELQGLETDGLDLGLVGFDEAELQKLLQGMDLPAEGIGENVPDSNYKEQYGVIVLCESEQQQETTYNSLTSQGLKCKVVTT